MTSIFYLLNTNFDLVEQNCDIKKDGELVMINSPHYVMTNGLIVKKVNDEWKCVNFPFCHIEEYSEESNIDWSTVETYLRIDGIMICAWSDCGQWHFSLRDDFNLGSAAERIGAAKMEELISHFQPPYCYTFILDKEDQLWFINRRNMVTLEEDTNEILPEWIKYPHHFKRLRNPVILRKLTETMQPSNGEYSYICVDGDGVRVKFDSVEWRKRQNNLSRLNTSWENVITLWQAGELADYIEEMWNNVDLVEKKKKLDALPLNAEEFYRNLVFYTRGRRDFMAHLPEELPITYNYCMERYLGRADGFGEEMFKSAPIADVMKEVEIGHYGTFDE